MAQKLSLFHPHLHVRLIIIQRFIEWVSAIVIMIAVYPVMVQFWMYLMAQLYEVFVQYQYLF